VIVVSDTSPITSLVDVDQVELLRTLFGTVIVPREVSRELERGRVGVPGWVEVRDLKDRSMVSRFSVEVDLGEAEALALAIELKCRSPADRRTAGACHRRTPRPSLHRRPRHLARSQAAWPPQRRATRP
jgi:predicted nucleic acid-binding protein